MKKTVTHNKGKLREPGQIAKTKAPIPKKDKPLGALKMAKKPVPTKKDKPLGDKPLPKPIGSIKHKIKK